MKQSITKKIISAVLLFCLTFTYFITPFSVKKADAILGFGDISFTTITADIPELIYKAVAKVVGVFLEKWKKRMITMLTNDMVNWIQNGTKPRFITDFKKFAKKAADQAAGEAIGDAFLSDKIDICQPFKAQVNILVNRVRTIKEPQVRCTLGDITENIGNLKEQLFAFGEDFYKGNWSAWMSLHEEYNSVPGSYLATKDIITTKAAQGTAAATAELTTGGGFLSSKKCAEYERQLFDIILPDGTIVETGVSPEVGDVKFLTDQQEWLSGKLKEYNLSANGDYGIAPSGQTEKSGKLSPLMDMDDLPPASKCIETTNVTPGKVIGDQISHLLQKTGIDNLTESDTLNQILNALIDAAVNRVAREGLSMVKVGKGSWTSPPKGGSGSNRQVQQTDTFGVESARALELLKTAVGVRTSAQELVKTLEQLADHPENRQYLRRRLGLKTGSEGKVIMRSFYYAGDPYETIPAALDTSLQCSHISEDGDAGSAIDKCLFGSNRTIGSVGEVDSKPWPDKKDFNSENNNPGPYLANQDLAYAIANVLYMFQYDKDTGVPMIKNTIPANKQSCELADLTFTFTPDDSAYLPFIDNQNSGDDNTGLKQMMWRSTKNSFPKEITNNNPLSYILASQWIGNLDTLVANLEPVRQDYEQIAESYTALIDGLADQIYSAKTEVEYISRLMPPVMDYASVLSDYDKAGRTAGLIIRLKNYSNALTGKYDVTWRQARDALGNGVVDKTYPDDGLATDDIALDTARELLLKAQADTRAEWLAMQDRAIAGTDNILKEQAQKKQPIIVRASKLIVNSLTTLVTTETSNANDSVQTGMSPSDAVAKAVNEKYEVATPDEKNRINFSVDLITSDLEDREARINKELRGSGDKLGKFEIEREKRVQLGLEGGNTEWAKYFRNRFVYAYVVMLYNFYRFHFTGVDLSTSARRGCDQTPQIEYVEYD